MESKREFVSGVVEGFYGRPWTSLQRIKLFLRLKQMGLNTYLYAPKDDLKHRQMWRDLYTENEIIDIKILIDASKLHNINFVYAVSPGLDITFSNSSDLFFLKQKMNQIKNLGCDAFALLFDDIEPTLNETDKTIFHSSAYAQATITNDIYIYLNKPSVFLFCPTEYCSTRAIPSVENSEYLQTIGATLLGEIDILWTGPKVISKSIPIESIVKLSTVLKRAPIIWDNMHANDYDNKRLFLGPYSGRSSKLRLFTRGVLLNPNCEFEANFIAMHTLAQWTRVDVSAIDGEESIESHYQPSQALQLALVDWLKLIYEKENFGNHQNFPKSQEYRMTSSSNELLHQTDRPQSSVSTSNIPESPKINSCIISETKRRESDDVGNVSFDTKYLVDGEAKEIESQTESKDEVLPSNEITIALPNKTGDNETTINEMELIPKIEEISESIENHNDMMLDSIMNTFPLTPMEIEDNPTDADIITDSMAMQIDNIYESACEKMDIIDDSENNNNSQKKKPKDIITSKDKSEMECALSNKSSEDSEILLCSDLSKLTVEDLHMLVNMFYLPYEHSSFAIRLLKLIYWLKSNAHKTYRKTKKISNEISENSDFLLGDTLDPSDVTLMDKYNFREIWIEKAEEFSSEVEKLRNMVDRFTNIPNRSVLYDLYPYLHDIRYIMSILNSYVKWMGCLPGYNESLLNDDHEPWVFRGGLLSEFQKMFPLEGSNDLFPNKISFKDVSDDQVFVNNLSASQPKCKDDFYCHLNEIHKDSICHFIYTIQPYRPFNRRQLYSLCFNLLCTNMKKSSCMDEKVLTEFKSEKYKDLAGDRFIGSFLDFSSSTCIIIEDSENRIRGYAFGTTKIRDYLKFLEDTYKPQMCNKYNFHISEEHNQAGTSMESIKTSSIIETLMKGFGSDTTDASIYKFDDSSHALIHMNIFDFNDSSDKSRTDDIGCKLLRNISLTLKSDQIEHLSPTQSEEIHQTILDPTLKICELSNSYSTFKKNTISPPVLLHTRSCIEPMTVFIEVDMVNKHLESFFKKYGFEINNGNKTTETVYLMSRKI